MIKKAIDITMCEGGNCPIKEKCHRYTATPAIHQSYMNPPFKIIKNKFECSMFWGESYQLLLEQLKGIIIGSESYKKKKNVRRRKNK